MAGEMATCPVTFGCELLDHLARRRIDDLGGHLGA